LFNLSTDGISDTVFLIENGRKLLESKHLIHVKQFREFAATMLQQKQECDVLNGPK